MPKKRKPDESLVSQIKEGPPAFTMVHDIRDPWADEQRGRDTEKLGALDIRDPWAETAKEPARQEARMPKQRERQGSFAARIAELRLRMENQSGKYHRGNIADRPRETSPAGSGLRLDRISRLGNEGGRRPMGAKPITFEKPVEPKKEEPEYWTGQNLQTLNVVPKKKEPKKI